MNDIQRTVANLRILADYIELHVSQNKLNMSKYRLDVNGCYTSFKSKHNCGTLEWAHHVPHEDFNLQLTDFNSGVDSKLNFFYYGKRLFPKLGASGLDWDGVFNLNLSSDKESVITRLREKANELENR